MSPFIEAPEAGNSQREQSLAQLDLLIEERKAQANAARAKYFAPRVDSLHHYEQDTALLRRDFAQMLGWPLVERAPLPERMAEQTLVAEDQSNKIYRLRIPAVGPLDLYGVLIVPPGSGPFPLVMAQHGAQGTPEMVAQMGVNSGNYHDLARRAAGRGAVVFAPQLFLNWRQEWGAGCDQFSLDADLKQLGGSRAALELLMLSRGLDFLLQRRDVNSQQVGIIGLSYGGFYALALAALETRIRVVLSSCWFNDRYRYNANDWVWPGSAHRFLDAEIASLVCPRPLFLEIGANDDVFGSELVAPELAKVRRRYEALQISRNFGFKEHGHGHAFDRGDDGLDFVFSHLNSW